MPERELITKALAVENRRKLHIGVYNEKRPEVLQRIRVLEGDVCTTCVHCRIRVRPNQNLQIVDLQCKLGHTPSDLYANLDLVEQPICKDYTPEN